MKVRRYKVGKEFSFTNLGTVVDDKNEKRTQVNQTIHRPQSVIYKSNRKEN